MSLHGRQEPVAVAQLRPIEWPFSVPVIAALRALKQNYLFCIRRGSTPNGFVTVRSGPDAGYTDDGRVITRTSSVHLLGVMEVPSA